MTFWLIFLILYSADLNSFSILYKLYLPNQELEGLHVHLIIVLKILKIEVAQEETLRWEDPARD